MYTMEKQYRRNVRYVTIIEGILSVWNWHRIKINKIRSGKRYFTEYIKPIYKKELNIINVIKKLLWTESVYNGFGPFYYGHGRIYRVKVPVWVSFPITHLIGFHCKG